MRTDGLGNTNQICTMERADNDRGPWLPRVKTVAETARWLKCSKRQVFRLLASGRLKATRLGARSTRVTEESITTLIQGD